MQHIFAVEKFRKFSLGENGSCAKFSQNSKTGKILTLRDPIKICDPGAPVVSPYPVLITSISARLEKERAVHIEFTKCTRLRPDYTDNNDAGFDVTPSRPRQP